MKSFLLFFSRFFIVSLLLTGLSSSRMSYAEDFPEKPVEEISLGDSFLHISFTQRNDKTGISMGKISLDAFTSDPYRSNISHPPSWRVEVHNVSGPRRHMSKIMPGIYGNFEASDLRESDLGFYSRKVVPSRE